MTDEEIERVARALDPAIWADDMPIPTRGDIMDFHERRAKSVSQARAAIQAMNQRGEPLAWRYDKTGSKTGIPHHYVLPERDSDLVKGGWTETPLYR